MRPHLFSVATLPLALVWVISLALPNVAIAALGRLNAFELDASGTAITGNLYTRVVGQTLQISVVALSPSKRDVDTGTTGSVKVELLGGQDLSGNLDTNNCPSSATVVTSATGTLTAGRGSAQLNVGNQPFLHARLRLSFPATGTPTLQACAEDGFAIRPSAITLRSTTSTGSATNTNASASATPTIKAGSNFSFNLESNTTGYNATLWLDRSRLQAHSPTDPSQNSGGVLGNLVLSNGDGLAVNANLSNNATYDEVGYLSFLPGAWRDDTYTSIDQPNDCVPQQAHDVPDSSGRVGCAVGNATNYVLGRFTPSYFVIVTAPVQPACTNMTYYGQAGLQTVLGILAKASNDIITKNYQGQLARLDPNNRSQWQFTADNLPSGVTLSAGAAVNTGNWTDGKINIFRAAHTFSRPSAPIAPADIVIKALPVDADGVTLANSTAVRVHNEASTPLRYGRLRLMNAHGSELLPLPMLMKAEMWTGSAWRTNVQDNCTGTSLTIPSNKPRTQTPNGLPGLWFSGEEASIANYLAPNETFLSVDSWANGAGRLRFSAPGNGNMGWLDVLLPVPEHLKGFWGNCLGQAGGSVSNLSNYPCARATFGVYSSGKVVFRREIY